MPDQLKETTTLFNHSICNTPKEGMLDHSLLWWRALGQGFETVIQHWKISHFQALLRNSKSSALKKYTFVRLLRFLAIALLIRRNQINPNDTHWIRWRKLSTNAWCRIASKTIGCSKDPKPCSFNSFFSAAFLAICFVISLRCPSDNCWLLFILHCSIH